MKTRISNSFYRLLKAFNTALTICCICTAPLFSFSQENSSSESAIKLINEVLQTHNLPSLSVAVSKRNKIVFLHSEGFADMELQAPATPKTVYRIGSISKSITAVLTVLLMQNDMLDLSSNINDYCPDFPNKRDKISISQLLTHQGGIRHYDFDHIEEEYFSTRVYNSSTEAISIFKNDTLVAKPGTKHFYSSYGYSLIGCAIENVMGTSFEHALEQYILNPVQMKNTMLDYPEQIIPQRAKPYDLSKSGDLKNSRPVHLSNKFPGGGILSTPTDLVKFGSALLQYSLLTKENLELLWQEQKTLNGNSTDYALGWRTSKNKEYIYHGGSSSGGKAFLLIVPDQELVVAFATNSSRFPVSRLEFAQQIATLFSK